MTSCNDGKNPLETRELIGECVNHSPYNDHNAMKKPVKSGEILEEVEKMVGELG